MLAHVLFAVLGAFQRPDPTLRPQPVQHVARHTDQCVGSDGEPDVFGNVALSLPAPRGNQYLYLSQLDIAYIGGGSLTPFLFETTTTNLGGVRWVAAFEANILNVNVKDKYRWPAGLKATSPGMPVIITTQFQGETMSGTINACYWVAP